MNIDFSSLKGHEDMVTPGTAEVALLRQKAVRFIEQIDRQEGLHTSKVWPLKAGMWNALYHFEPAGVVAKLSANPNEFETKFLREAALVGVTVPQVLAEGKLEHPDLQQASYFLMNYLADCVNPAQLLLIEHTLTPPQLDQLALDISHEMAKLHRVHLGYVAHFEQPVANWKECLTDGFSPDWNNPRPNQLFDDDLLRTLKTLVETTHYFEFSDGYLTHGDLNLNNVLVDNTTHRLRAIVDPGGYAGMPMYDLAYATMPWEYGFNYMHTMIENYQREGGAFDQTAFYISLLVVAYRHERFHTPTVKTSIKQDILPMLDRNIF